MRPIVQAGKPILLHIRADAERRLRAGHPWLYERAILRQSRVGLPGELAVIYDRRNRFLAIGLYDPLSPLRVRVLQRYKPVPIDGRWFHARLSEAVRRRAALHGVDTTGYRLVHGENDGLPGLVLDRYEDTLVLKLYTAAWAAHLPQVQAAVREVWPFRRLVLRLSRAVQAQDPSASGLQDGAILAGPALRRAVVFLEHGLRFEVDPIRGQKTGFFLDQRDNRARVERMARGAAVLDAFAYTGAFSVHAARGGAKIVLSLDASHPALQAAARNMALNRHLPGIAAVSHELLAGDVFAQLSRLRRQRRVFELVILDPPAFATTAAQVPN